MLYHYTDRLSGADILNTGTIEARPICLHKDIFGNDKGFVTKPIVWLTTNPVIERTVIHKMITLGGWPDTLINDVWRFCLPKDYAPLGLAEYGEQENIEADYFTWMVATGQLIGSDYRTWRLLPENIPAKDWLTVEVLRGFDSQSETMWMRHNFSLSAQ